MERSRASFIFEVKINDLLVRIEINTIDKSLVLLFSYRDMYWCRLKCINMVHIDSLLRALGQNLSSEHWILVILNEYQVPDISSNVAQNFWVDSG